MEQTELEKGKVMCHGSGTRLSWHQKRHDVIGGNIFKVPPKRKLAVSGLREKLKSLYGVGHT